MSNQDSDRQFEDVWKRVSGSLFDQPEGLAFSGAGNERPVRESDMDTVLFLRHHHKEEEKQWRRMLELKEKNLQELNLRLEEAEAGIKDLKSRYQAEQEKSLYTTLDASSKIEETSSVLRRQKEAHSRDIRVLHEIIERTKLETKQLQTRIDESAKARDELEKKCARISRECETVKESRQELEKRLAGVKDAVEKTLAELFAERKAKAEAESDKQKYSVRIQELESALREAKANWEAERKEWRELWDRERSIWSAHRQEFAVWEERLRSERQAWNERLKGEEMKEMEYASQITKVLKESSEWSQRVAQILRLFASKGIELPKIFVSEPVAKTGNKSVGRILAGLVLTGLLSAVGFYMHGYFTAAHFKLSAEAKINLPNPTALLPVAEGLWVSDWERGVMLLDKKDVSRTLRSLRMLMKEPFRAGALVSDGGYLWILDIAQLRIIRQSPHDKEGIMSVKTPGPAPSGMAFDGVNLWTFDSSTKLLYRFALNPASGIESSYALPGVNVPVCMQWVSKTLWVLESGGALKRLSFENGVFKMISEQKVSPRILSFYAEGAVFWTLERKEKSGSGETGFIARKYALKVYGKQ